MMERREIPDDDERTASLDLAGSVLLGAGTLLCAALSLAGLDLAALALPFLSGALAGDALFYLAVRSTRYRVPLVVAALVAVVFGLIFSFGLWSPMLLPVNSPIPWKIPGYVERFALGLTIGFGGLILSTVIFHGPLSPLTWEEAVGQRRELTRGTLVVVGVLLALLAALGLLFGFFALVAYFTARFAT